MRIVARGASVNAADVGDLQTALNQLPAHGGTVYLPAGTYEVDRPVLCELAERQHLCLYGEGRASVIRFTPEDGSHFLTLRGVENSWWPDLKITLRDLTLIGNHRCGDALHLLWPNDALVDTCFFQGFGGTAVWIGPNATNVTVRDCWMRDCRRALYAENLHHLTFHGNQTRSVDKVGQKQAEHVYIGRHCREVRIVNNHLAYGHAEGIILDGTAQHVITGNTIEGFTAGIRAVDCRDIVISNNYLHTPTGVLMEAENRGLIVSNNLFTTNSAGAIRIRDARGAGGHVISGNVIRLSVYDDAQGGIDLGDATACVVTGNAIEDLTAGDAIRAEPPAAHTLTANQVTDTAAQARAKAPAADVPMNLGHASPLQPLHAYLSALPGGKRRVVVPFWDLRRLLGDALPSAAERETSWWANDPATPQAHAWLSAGWLVAQIHRIEGRVVFARTRP